MRKNKRLGKLRLESIKKGSAITQKKKGEREGKEEEHGKSTEHMVQGKSRPLQ